MIYAKVVEEINKTNFVVNKFLENRAYFLIMWEKH